MSTVIFDASMSLDGCMTPTGQTPDHSCAAAQSSTYTASSGTRDRNG